MVVDPDTDKPEQRFAAGSTLLTADGSELTVERYEQTDRSPIVTFAEIGDREEAEALRGLELFIPAAERRRLDDDEFWPDELVGMAVEAPSGERIGVVTGIEEGAGQDRLIIDTPTGEVTVPFVAELVPEISRQARRVVVAIPEGLTG